MLKTLIINLVMFALIAYDVVLFCRYKGWLTIGRKKGRQSGACQTQAVSPNRGKHVSK